MRCEIQQNSQNTTLSVLYDLFLNYVCIDFMHNVPGYVSTVLNGQQEQSSPLNA